MAVSGLEGIEELRDGVMAPEAPVPVWKPPPEPAEPPPPVIIPVLNITVEN